MKMDAEANLIVINAMDGKNSNITQKFTRQDLVNLDKIA